METSDKQSRRLNAWRQVWESIKHTPMLFVTFAVLIVLCVFSLPALDSYSYMRIWMVAILVGATVVDTVMGMIADIRDGHVGLDILAVVAILSTLAVGEFWASWVVVLMIYSGSVIEDYAESSAEHNLTALLSAQPHIAHVMRPCKNFESNLPSKQENHTLADISADDVQIMDLLLIKPGETIPVDGVVMSERAVVDMAMINGESLPRTILNAQRVPSGAVNGAESFILRATAKAEDSQYQRIISLVQEAQNSRPRVVRTADLLAVPFTVIAFTIAGLAWFFSGDPTRFAQVLVLATPCPLLISAPVAYLGGTSRLAASGVLIKGQEVIEQLVHVSHIFFDKTGTLTVKQPRVVKVERSQEAAARKWDNVSDDLLLAVAGMVESYSIHILAQGITRAGRDARQRLNGNFDNRLTLDDVKHVVEHSGLGITAQVDGYDIRIGRLEFVRGEESDNGFVKPRNYRHTQVHGLRLQRQTTVNTAGLANMQEGNTHSSADADSGFLPLEPSQMAAYMSINGDVVSRIVMQDVPRDNARETIVRIRQLGIRDIAMLTGDSFDSAERIAKEVGINLGNVHSELLPEGKQRIVKKIKLADTKLNDTVTMMVGDGVNDAPVLASADIGVAVTDGSSSAASQTAQMVIMNDDISLIPRAIEIARYTRNVMFHSVLGGLALATIAMIVAAFGVIPAVFGAFGQEAIDVISILWALTAVRERK